MLTRDHVLTQKLRLLPLPTLVSSSGSDYNPHLARLSSPQLPTVLSKPWAAERWMACSVFVGHADFK